MLDVAQQARLSRLFAELDPVRVLRQRDRLQDALWHLAVFPTVSQPPQSPAEAPVLFQGTVCGFGATHEVSEVVAEPAVAEGSAPARQKRRYRRSTPEHGPRTYRTRPDPFAAVLTVIAQRLEANPELTAKAIFRDLQAEYPGRYPEVQLRTLQRRIAAWRAQALLTFQDQWLAEDHLQAASLLRGNVDWRSEDEAPE